MFFTARRLHKNFCSEFYLDNKYVLPSRRFRLFFYYKNLFEETKNVFCVEIICLSPYSVPGRGLKIVFSPFFIGQKNVFPVPDGDHVEKKKSF